ncbi:MAG: hypothetical protein QOH96_2018 [Blastocatellia bacterium]|jgi:signal transduction histidine kinase/DNA-binding response OmpR family regulator|nr:hypothetical protein [Blastocatellia bacterium]
MQSEQQQIDILLVDDKPNNLLALETILEFPGRNLVRASSGDEALRFLLEKDVAVILLDVHMPGISGLETAALIRGRERSRNTPIIFLTADNNGGTLASRGYSLGAVDYIQKPLDPEILRSKVAVFVELFKKTEEVKAQAKLLQTKNIELENANFRRLSMLVDLGQQLASERDPGQLLKKFCIAARDITEASFAAVGVFEVGQVGLVYFHRSTHSGATGGKVSVKLFEDLLKQIDPSPEGPTSVDATRYRKILAKLSPSGERLQSLLLAPILASSRHYGWLCLANENGPNEFTGADERLAVTMTSQVAVAYENALLYAEAQQHAAELQQEAADRMQAEREIAMLLVREQQARAEAETANRTKDEFLAILSHELRTPLTAILGWVHLLRLNKLAPESTENALETIERNAKSQSQLIDDLLDVSRIVTGKLRLESQLLEVDSIVETVIESVRPLAASRTIELKYIPYDSRILIRGDHTRLQQIVWNLLSNAIKFTHAGGIVRVTLGLEDGNVVLRVRDTGIGISPDFLPHVFDRFRQADGTTTRTHGGLGLGLAIVQHLVELHGGSIAAENAIDGVGAIFTVKLPPIEENEEESAYSDSTDFLAGTSVSIDEKTLTGISILVVDDEIDAREMICTILEGYGSQVCVCGSVAEAMKALDTFRPNVILSDIGMPAEDGYSFIKRLRDAKDTEYGEVPAIALTAYAAHEDRVRSLAAGFQMHINKPLEPAELVSAIRHLVGRQEKNA